MTENTHNQFQSFKRHAARKKITPPLGGIGKNIEELIQKVVISLYSTIKIEPKSLIGLTWTEQTDLGDYSTTVALRLAAIVKKQPLVIAKEIVTKLSNLKAASEAKTGDQNTIKQYQIAHDGLHEKDILQAIHSIQCVAPGYINIQVNDNVIGTLTSQVLDMKQSFGQGFLKKGVKIMVEFTDPNPFKEFHIGHLYSNAVGESLSRLMEAQGAEVKRANFFGDVGMHVAKALYGVLAKIKDQKAKIKSLNQKSNIDPAIVQEFMDNLESKSLSERIKFLGQCYAFGATEYDKSDNVKEQMKRINFLVFLTAQEYMKTTFQFEPHIDYAKYIQNVTEIEKKIIWELYSRGREWSLAYFETIYARLGTKFDYYFPESITGEYGVQMVRSHVADGVFEESDGAIVYKGEKVGLHTRVFINTLGLPTYETKDLGNAKKKYMDFPYDESIISTGNEINDYFDVMLAALSEFEPELSKKTLHIGHGMVRLPEGKMSSRTGKILTGLWLLDEANKQIKEKMESSKHKVVPEDKIDETADILSVAAVKYALLRSSIGSDVIFDFDTSISVDGDSGPYLVYTYARCKSILRKYAEISNVKFQMSNEVQMPEIKSQNSQSDVPNLDFDIDLSFDIGHLTLNKEERLLARIIMQFPDVVASASINLAPSTICTYLYDLAQTFNNFYTKHQVLVGSSQLTENSSQNKKEQDLSSTNDERQTMNFRLILTEATAQTLQNGLHLLGIKTVERM
jgi:arginyl-tRNA synthetase